MSFKWENPEIFKINKEDGHVIAMPYDDARQAAEGQECPYKLSLNGSSALTRGFPTDFMTAALTIRGGTILRCRRCGS